MKNLFLIFLLAGSYASAKSLTCTSDDFNPNNYDGQQAVIEISDNGTLSKVTLKEGSWGVSEDSIVENLQIVSQRSGLVVYSFDLDDDNYNHRLIVKAGSNSVSYQFMAQGDDRSYAVKYELKCSE